MASKSKRRTIHRQYQKFKLCTVKETAKYEICWNLPKSRFFRFSNAKYVQYKHSFRMMLARINAFSPCLSGRFIFKKKNCSVSKLRKREICFRVDFESWKLPNANVLVLLCFHIHFYMILVYCDPIKRAYVSNCRFYSIYISDLILYTSQFEN